MQKQQLAFKSLKIHLSFQSWSNFPARNQCDLKLEPLYLCTVCSIDFLKDTILCIIEKIGIGVGRQEIIKQARGFSVIQKKFRHKTWLLFFFSCILHTANCHQMFKCKCLSVLTCFAVLYLLLLYFRWIDLLPLFYFYICAVHARRFLAEWPYPQNIVLQEPLRVRNCCFHLKEVVRRMIQSYSDLFLQVAQTLAARKEA